MGTRAIGTPWFSAIAFCASLLVASACSTRTYDLVISNGHVMDPESGFDRVAHVGIVGDRIAAISDRPLRGVKTIDASGLIVAPGLIELHTHGEDSLNYRYRAMDGITTMLDTERGTVDVDQWYADRNGKTLVNYGISAGHSPARVQVMKGEYHGFHFSGPARTNKASPEELEQIVSLVRNGLARGALGVGLMPFYTPAATQEELRRMFELAAGVPGAVCYVHLRYTGLGTKDKPGGVAALQEVLDLSKQTKAPLHVCHVSTSGLAATPTLLAMIGDAKRQGFDVTTEFYPYTAAMSGINSTWFDPGWQEALGIGYDKLQWPATGEFLTEKTFRKYQRENPSDEVIIHAIPQDAFEAAVKSPYTMVVSDGLVFPNLVAHPRSSGTSARVLGRLVRDQGLLTMMEALRKMTLMPAQRLEARVPEMKNKGRVRVGADADLTIFNPATVIDKAVFGGPAKYSEGFRYVLVAGVPIVYNGELQSDVAPGRPVRARITEGRRPRALALVGRGRS
jgi:N-acyl-D-aspartate/D-glutamate deacylase